MKIEEAIEILENGDWWDLLIPITTIEGRSDEDKLHQAIDMAITALRSVSREQELEAENKELKERIVNWRKYMPPHGSRWRRYGGVSGCFRFSQAKRMQTTQDASAPSVGALKLRLQGIGFAPIAALL